MMILLRVYKIINYNRNKNIPQVNSNMYTRIELSVPKFLGYVQLRS